MVIEGPNNGRWTGSEAAAMHWANGELFITPHHGGRDFRMRIDAVWVEDNLASLATNRPYTLTSEAGNDWLDFSLNTSDRRVIISEFALELGHNQFSHGSTSTINLAERPMFVELFRLDTPKHPQTGLNDTGSPAIESQDAVLVVEFADGNTSGQLLEYSQAWLDSLGIHAPVFAYEDGTTIPHKLVDGVYQVQAPHFSALYTFNSDEGFSRETDRTYSHIWWDSSNQIVQVKQDRRDASDEIWSKNFPSQFTATTGGEVRATHTVTTHGKYQSHIPLFIAKSTVTDINTGQGVAYFYYQGNENSGAGNLFMRIRSPTGALVYENSISAPSGVTRELSIQYYGNNDYAFRIVHQDQGYYDTFEVYLPNYPDVSFQKWGVATNGWSGSGSYPAQYATIDNMFLRYGGTYGSDDDPACRDALDPVSGYQCTKVPYSPQAMTGSTTVSLGDDSLSSPISLPFQFPWFGGIESQVTIASNGYLTFDTSQTWSPYTSDDNPSTASPNDLVACGWEDLNPTVQDGMQTSRVHYEAYGAAPNRVFIVEFENVYHYNQPTSLLANGNDFQIQLHENGDVYCMIGDFVDDTDLAKTSIGIQNSDGTRGLSYLYGEGALRNIGVRFIAPPANENPYTPILTSPAYGATGVSWSPTLSWNSNGDPDADIVTYTVKGSVNGGAYTTVCTTTHPTRTCTWGGLARGTSHSWYVQASDSKGGLATSDAWSFTTKPNSAPYMPLFPDPFDGAMGIAWSPGVSWSSNGDPDGDATTYTVWRSSGGAYSNVCTVTHPTKSCSWSGLARGKTYWWYVRASDGALTTTSSVWSFTTKANTPPNACLSLSATYLRVKAESSCSDPDGDFVSHTFRWGDGSEESTGFTNMLPIQREHVYGDAYCPTGTATVTLTTSDLYGGSSSSTRSIAISGNGQDADQDGLIACEEAKQGTSDGTVDTDADGLTDYLEWSGHASRKHIFCPSPSSPDSSCEYPNPTQRDLYVEVDWQTGFGLSAAVLQTVSDAYANSPLSQDIRLVIDTGQLGGGGASLGAAGMVTWNDVENYQDTMMASNRQGIFHYGVVACREDSGVGGRAETPGDLFALYFGDLTCTSQNTDQRKTAVFLHELGHNILGNRLMISGGSNINGCTPYASITNAALNGDFAYVEPIQDPYDCDGDRRQDLFPHSTRNTDAMWGDELTNQDDYRSTTWNAVRLDMAVGPNAPSCQQILPGSLANLGLLGPPCSVTTSHGDPQVPIGMQALWVSMAAGENEMHEN